MFAVPMRDRCFWMASLLLFLWAGSSCHGQERGHRGVVAGRVVDRQTLQPIPAVSIRLLGTPWGTVTDTNGRYRLHDLPVGTYRLRVSAVGYAEKIIPDVVVVTRRNTVVDVELEEHPFEAEALTIEANYFRKNVEEIASSHSYRFEEIRRSAGAAEDVSRVVQSLPGVAASTDARNDLVVRGGSPTENLTLLDNVEVPNANHFGTQGATGGPISMINVEFIDEVRFFTGGFDVRYGDRLSSVLDIRMREGSAESVRGDVNLSSAGFGALIEGPAGPNANWMLSARKSFLDLLVSPLGLGAVPHYSNAQFKAAWRPDDRNMISLLGIAGVDEVTFSASDRNEQEPRVMFMNTRDLQNQYTAGARWKSLWNSRAFSEAVISVSGSNFLIDVRDSTGAYVFRNASADLEFQGKAELYCQAGAGIQILGGISFKPARYQYDIHAAADTTPLGFAYPALSTDREASQYKTAAYAHAAIPLLPRMTVVAGIRADYFSLNRNWCFSPRLGITFALNPVASIHAHIGRYFQSPTYLWVSSDPVNASLKNLRADQAIIGAEYFPAADLKISLEAYDKEYADYPVSLLVPTFIFVNGGADYGLFLGGPAVSAGTGYVRGIDFFLQKKMAGDFYGIISYSYSRSAFKALAGGWQPGAFDYRHVFTVNGGVRLSDTWEISGKWRYAGGRPYTPFDEALSTAAGRGVSDFRRINSARYPPYHRLDLRADYRLNFESWSLVCYLELQNVYDRRNVYTYFWDEVRNRREQVNQWSFFPVGGFRVKF